MRASGAAGSSGCCADDTMGVNLRGVEEGVLAFPRTGAVLAVCQTTNFGAQGGTADCPINQR